MKAKQYWHSIKEYYPLTLLGSMLLGVVFYLAGVSTVSGNPYGLLLSISGFLTLLLLWLRGWLFTRKLDFSQVSWLPGVRIQAGRNNDGSQLRTSSRTPLLFRFHFHLRGALNVNQDQDFILLKEFSGVSDIDTPLAPPFSGMLSVKGRLRVQDVFGLIRIRVGDPVFRKLHVYPAFLQEMDTPVLPVEAGAEKEKIVKKSDLERIFMRDYTPGDLTRDINWKASSRMSGVFTRVSPESEDKSKILYLVYRPYANMSTTDLHTLTHLDHLRRRLFTFIRYIRTNYPDYLMEVHAGDKVILIGDDTEEDLCYHHMIETAFHKDSSVPGNFPEGNFFIFSTGLDTRLAEYLSTLSRARVFITRPGWFKTAETCIDRRLRKTSGPAPLHGFYLNPARIRRNRMSPLPLDREGHEVNIDFLRTGL